MLRLCAAVCWLPRPSLPAACLLAPHRCYAVQHHHILFQVHAVAGAIQPAAVVHSAEDAGTSNCDGTLQAGQLHIARAAPCRNACCALAVEPCKSVHACCTCLQYTPAVHACSTRLQYAGSTAAGGFCSATAAQHRCLLRPCTCLHSRDSIVSQHFPCYTEPSVSAPPN